MLNEWALYLCKSTMLEGAGMGASEAGKVNAAKAPRVAGSALDCLLSIDGYE